MIFMIHDLVDPNDPQGRTYRQINAARTHAIPVGTLVEIQRIEGDNNHGVRLFVVHHGRDCDMTPLYYLSYEKDDTTEREPGFRNRSWTGGFPEEVLRVVDRAEPGEANP